MKRNSSAMAVPETGVTHRRSRSSLAWLRLLRVLLVLIATLALACKPWCSLQQFKAASGAHSYCCSGHTQPKSGHRNRDCCQIDRSVPEIGSRIEAAPTLPLLVVSPVRVIAATLTNGPISVADGPVQIACASVSPTLLTIYAPPAAPPPFP